MEWLRLWWEGLRGMANGLFAVASPPNGGDAVIGRETRVLLRHYLEQGFGKAAVARQAGVSRRTVHRRIAPGQLDRELDDEPVRRFEAPPGHQGQGDFAEFKTPWAKRHVLVVVLGYSRLLWVPYYERQAMAVVMEGLQSPFRYFGGVPSELLFDRMKAVIVEDNREVGGRLMENLEFLRFAYH